jgi:outer membrane protein assembly factor BamD
MRSYPTPPFRNRKQTIRAFPVLHRGRLVFVAVAIVSSIICSSLGQEIDASAALYETARQQVMRGQPERAIEKFKAIVRLHPKSRFASRAQFQIAELYAQNREFSEGFNAAQKFIETYPESELFLEALNIQFAMAERVAEEYRRLRAKNDKSDKNLPGRAYASEMFRVIANNGRQSEYAAKALYRLGTMLDEEKRPTEAIEAFQLLLKTHPNSALADDAAFQVGFVDYRQSREQNRERGSQERARLAFEDFVIRYPNSEKMAEGHHLLNVLRGWERDKLLQAARYYESSGQAEAALRTYREALRGNSEGSDIIPIKEKILELENATGR